MGANVFTDNSIVAKEADIIFLAVKPHILGEALTQILTSKNSQDVKNKLFISILAGLTTADLEKVGKNRMHFGCLELLLVNDA